MMDQVSKLTHDLEPFNQLKKEFVDDELELSWDRQHIAELQDSMKSMKDSFEKVARTFGTEEEDLVKKNESLREALVTSSHLNSSVQKLDQGVFLQLSRQAARVHMELDAEMAENAALRKALADTMWDMEKQKMDVPQAAALRGSSSPSS